MTERVRLGWCRLLFFCVFFSVAVSLFVSTSAISCVKRNGAHCCRRVWRVCRQPVSCTWRRRLQGRTVRGLAVKCSKFHRPCQTRTLSVNHCTIAGQRSAPPEKLSSLTTFHLHMVADCNNNINGNNNKNNGGHSGHPDNSHTLLNVSHLGNEVPGSKKKK